VIPVPPVFSPDALLRQGIYVSWVNHELQRTLAHEPKLAAYVATLSESREQTYAVLLCATQCEVAARELEILQCCAAAQLTIAGMFIFDDMIDDEPRHLGGPSYWKEHGYLPALRASSQLQDLGVEICPPSLRDALLRVQTSLMRHQLFGTKVVSGKRLVEITIQNAVEKAGTLFAFCCSSPYVLTGGDPRAALEFGTTLGKTLQLASDVWDYVPNQHGLEKNYIRHEDYQSGQLNLVLAHCYERANVHDRAWLLKSWTSPRHPSEKDFERLLLLLDKTAAITTSQETVAALLGRITLQADSLGLPADLVKPLVTALGSM
jgi:geranylgeranyl pyrophosphate synthase